MPTWNKRYIDLKVEEMTKQNVYIVGQGSVDRTNKGKTDGKITIYPYTIVNLLGKYGDFETDSNADGLADGWNAESNDGGFTVETESIFGSKSQRIYRNNITGNEIYPKVYRSYSIDYTHKYFASVYFKCGASATNTNLPYLYMRIFDNENHIISTKNICVSTRATTWVRHYGVFQDFDSATSYVYFAPMSSILPDGYIEEIYIDGAMLVDLTAMGALPYGLQQYFSPSGITQWEDLATTSNITALDGRTQTGEDWLAELLPYVSGISTLGFAWEGI